MLKQILWAKSGNLSSPAPPFLAGSVPWIIQSSPSPESEWPEWQDRRLDALIRLDNGLRLPIQELKI
jgi:hypothetical protein